ncbi:MAG: hypothetical protein DRJ01_13850 [Bacteroidetes bacterium]|nr:MAG: hypothetical protein DRJ01_13850 [Bacteroidota bacterium]
MKKILLILIFFLYQFVTCFATHNRAGEITYKQISDFTYEITVITFTNTKPDSSFTPPQYPADRPSLEVRWGDNTYSIVPRTEIVDLPNFYRRNKYVERHTFPGPGNYEIVVEDPNRNKGVVNIPTSVTVVFSIKTIMKIDPVLGFNSTPILLNPPVDKAAVGKVFIHNPAAYDPDGDSISYKLTTCTGENGEPIKGYTFPESSNKPIYVNEVTGDLVWDAPVRAGIYNVAILIEEWRKNIKIGNIVRDMQIEVYDSENNPPVIDSIAMICIEADSIVSFEVSAHDVDNDVVTLSATGGIFELDNVANFVTVSDTGNVTGTFIWKTNCSNVREQAYQVLFKAQDDNREINLVDQRNVNIKVIGPAPKNLQASPTNNSVELYWDSCRCSQVTGYEIYRSNTKINFIHDDCETGVPQDSSYALIGNVEGNSNTYFLDNNNGDGLAQGYDYCYMIVATYPDGSRSYASQEVCTELVRGIPVITNVSVNRTDTVNGSINLVWSKPTELDTNIAPGPYKYLIYHSNDFWGNNLSLIHTNYDINDTTFTDTLLNTVDYPYSYKVEIHNNSGLVDTPMIASSMFLDIEAADNKLTLIFRKNIPWENDKYVIYKQNKTSLEFDSLDISPNDYYTDENLKNGTEYCYRIKSIGKYDVNGFVEPIINFSQKNCEVPLDTIPPEPPVLEVNSDCDNFINILNWTNSSPDDEIIKYNIYYSKLADAELEPIASTNSGDSTTFIHKQTIAGCYAVTAFDSVMNESKKSNKVCVDNCTFYELPNVFTPNGDNVNDLFSPLTPADVISKFIESIDFKVYSRWGNLVFKTTDPQINWDGKISDTNKLISPGVYYYVCDVYEYRITGIEPRYLIGFIHVYDSKNSGLKP